MFPMLLLLASAIDDPCALLTRTDIHEVFAWNVDPGVRKEFHLPAANANGALCTYDSRDGSVVVTIGHGGAGLPNNDATDGLAPIREGDEVKGLGLPTDIGPSQAVVHYKSHDYGISVQFSDANFADSSDLKKLASAMIRRLQPTVPARKAYRKHG